MADILDEGIPPAGAIIFIAFMFFWFLPDKLLPALSKINESETLLITPFQIYIVGVLLIIGVFYLFLSKR